MAEQTTAAEPLLDISTLAPTRQTISIDGTLYELRLMEDFGIADQQALTRDGEEFDRLWNQEKLSKNERARLEMLLGRMFDKVLPLPDEVRAKLSDAHKARVVLTFTVAPLLIGAAQTETETEAAESASTTAS